MPPFFTACQLGLEGALLPVLLGCLVGSLTFLSDGLAVLLTFSVKLLLALKCRACPEPLETRKVGLLAFWEVAMKYPALCTLHYLLWDCTWSIAQSTTDPAHSGG